MADMAGNESFKLSTDNLAHALRDHPPGSSKCTDTLSASQAQATLALAYEQRTANLIQCYYDISATPEMRDQILARLGLRND